MKIFFFWLPSLVRGAMSWSSMHASVAPWVLVMLHTVSATVMSVFSTAEPFCWHRQTTSRSDCTSQGIWSIKDSASPAGGRIPTHYWKQIWKQSYILDIVKYNTGGKNCPAGTSLNDPTLKPKSSLLLARVTSSVPSFNSHQLPSFCTFAIATVEPGKVAEQCNLNRLGS